jgi:hypothetical protein
VKQTLPEKGERYRQGEALVMQLCIERATLIAERFGSLDEELVSRDRKAIREHIETAPKIRKWFQDLARLST